MTSQLRTFIWMKLGSLMALNLTQKQCGSHVGFKRIKRSRCAEFTKGKETGRHMVLNLWMGMKLTVSWVWVYKSEPNRESCIVPAVLTFLGWIGTSMFFFIFSMKLTKWMQPTLFIRWDIHAHFCVHSDFSYCNWSYCFHANWQGRIYSWKITLHFADVQHSYNNYRNSHRAHCVLNPQLKCWSPTWRRPDIYFSRNCFTVDLQHDFLTHSWL